LLALLVAAAPHFQGRTWNDCAPWDGPAFRVVVPLPRRNAAAETSLWFSIWEPAAFRAPRTFVFPRDAGRGSVLLQSGADSSSLLHGTLRIERAVPDTPVRGRFDLSSRGGGTYRGTFTAPWQPRQGVCR
jgi:hypothetical protein